MRSIGEGLFPEQEPPVVTISHQHISVTMDHDEYLLPERGIIMEGA